MSILLRIEGRIQSLKSKLHSFSILGRIDTIILRGGGGY